MNTFSPLSLLRWIIILIFLIFALFPIFWILKTSFTPSSLLFSEGVRWWPSQMTSQHYANVERWSSFKLYFLNSIWTSLGAALVATVIAAMAGYSLSRWSFGGKAFITVALFATQMFSLNLLVVPLTHVMTAIGLFDTIQGLGLAYVAANLPMAIFLMRSFFDTLPHQLEEAAMLDGYGRTETIIRFVAPLTLPGLGTTLGFVFVEAWSELFLSLTLLNTESEKTLPAGLMALSSKLGVDWGQVSAAGMLTLIPALIFFLVIQRFLVSGLTAGAVKG